MTVCLHQHNHPAAQLTRLQLTLCGFGRQRTAQRSDAQVVQRRPRLPGGPGQDRNGRGGRQPCSRPQRLVAGGRAPLAQGCTPSSERSGLPHLGPRPLLHGGPAICNRSKHGGRFRAMRTSVGDTHTRAAYKNCSRDSARAAVARGIS